MRLDLATMYPLTLLLNTKRCLRQSPANGPLGKRRRLQQGAWASKAPSGHALSGHAL